MDVQRSLEGVSKKLLDEIDQLRSNGISHYIDLPQLIVTGAQSSGKSSTLEAISGVHFPSRSGVCTRFPTEVILRRSVTESANVSIVPNMRCSDEQIREMRAFHPSITELDELPSIIEEAKEVIGINDTYQRFSSSVLRVEISGQNQPHLTIVDLPGLISTPDNEESRDVEVIEEMVGNYMKNPRSIILAIVSAGYEYNNQGVLSLARAYDSKRIRTLGIVTKPDDPQKGADYQKKLLDLIQNRIITLKHGWHVLRNRDPDERELTATQRDVNEERFFEMMPWIDLPRAQVGVSKLRERLSSILFNHIQVELPSLAAEIRAAIQSSQNTLNRLGHARETPDQQRAYLMDTSILFQSIVKAALQGNYEDEFFGNPKTETGSKRRLRAKIQNAHIDFAKSMRLHGQERIITEDAGNSTTPVKKAKKQKTISRHDFVTEIMGLLQISRGRELPGMYNPMIVLDIFRQQSSPWRDLARNHIINVTSLVNQFLSEVIYYLTEDNVGKALLIRIIEPEAGTRFAHMQANLTSGIIDTYILGHPITYNHYFITTVQDAREKRREEELIQKLNDLLSTNSGPRSSSIEIDKSNVKSIASQLAERSEEEMDRFACSDILDYAEAYYKVTRKTIVDNIATEAVEAGLLKNLQDIFSPKMVLDMSDDVVDQIAAEPQADKSLRASTQKKLEVLQKGLFICQSYISTDTDESEAVSPLLHKLCGDEKSISYSSTDDSQSDDEVCSA